MEKDRDTRGGGRNQTRQSGKSGVHAGSSYADLKNILGFSNRYTYEDVAEQVFRTVNMHGDLNLNAYKGLFIR